MPRKTVENSGTHQCEVKSHLGRTIIIAAAAALSCFVAGWLVGTRACGTGDAASTASRSPDAPGVQLLLDAGAVKLIDATLQLRPIIPPDGALSSEAASTKGGAADE